jgi:hypothetical protein
MGPEIPWNWFRPGPQRDAARARDRKRRQAMKAKATGPPVTRAKRNAKIRHLWGEGASGVEIARRFGLARSTVSQIVAASASGTARTPRQGERSEIVWPHPRRRFRASIVADGPSPPAPSRPTDPADQLGARETPKGSANGRAKLDEPKVIEMRRLRREDWSTGRLARKFGVSRNTVCYALSGVTWSDVPGAIAPNGGTQE